ncbi:hypothetical protein ACHAWF_009832 [Thalassiosira exigua]
MASVDGNSTKDGATTNTCVWRDVAGFFILGILADALPGYFFSATVLKLLSIPCGSVAPLSLSADVGGVVGVFAASFLLVKLSPELRVCINVAMQSLGIILSWTLSYPSNMVGIAILTTGFVANLTTLLPLTVYKSDVATRAYQVGFSAAPILGIALVEIGNAAGLKKNGLFALALCIPIVTTISFYFIIDRSPWNTKTAKEDDAEQNKYDAEDVEDENFIESQDANAGNTKERGENTDTHEQIQCDGKDDANGVDGQKKSTVNNSGIEVFHRGSLPPEGLKRAAKEMVIRYWPAYTVCFAVNHIWSTSVMFPFQSSSLTFGGQDGDKATNTSNEILLLAHVAVFATGIAITIPFIGGRLSRVNPMALWVPTLIQAALIFSAVAGVHGAFSPLPVSAAYVFTIFVMALFYSVYLYAPLIMRNDSALTGQYLEFEIQTLAIVMNVIYLITDIIAVVWAADSVIHQCKANYESLGDDVSCTFFESCDA